MFINNVNIHSVPAMIPKMNKPVVRKNKLIWRMMYKVLFYFPKVLKFILLFATIVPLMYFCVAGTITFVSEYPHAPEWSLGGFLLGVSLSFFVIIALCMHTISSWDKILTYIKNKIE